MKLKLSVALVLLVLAGCADQVATKPTPKVSTAATAEQRQEMFHFFYNASRQQS